MAQWRSRISRAGIKRLAGLLILLAFCAAQLPNSPVTISGEYAHAHHHAGADHDQGCQSEANPVSMPAPGGHCPENASMPDCPLASCCWQCIEGLERIALEAILIALSHRLEDDGAVLSRAPRPQDRPPRLV